jgi:hypothetical protein
MWKARREAMRANRAGKGKNALGGPSKSLITLDSDKEIQAFPLVGFGRAWLDLAQFGFGLDFPWTLFTADAEPGLAQLGIGLDSSAACFRSIIRA